MGVLWERFNGKLYLVLVMLYTGKVNFHNLRVFTYFL